jgi:hypothetical protein
MGETLALPGMPRCAHAAARDTLEEILGAVGTDRR